MCATSLTSTRRDSFKISYSRRTKTSSEILSSLNLFFMVLYSTRFFDVVSLGIEGERDPG